MVSYLNNYYYMQIVKIVRAIRKGWIKPKKDDKIEKPRYYLIWDKEDDKVCTTMSLGREHWF